MQSLTLTQDANLPSTLAIVADKARDYVKASTAENTKRAYQVAWADFARWCQDNGQDALPASPVTVGLYLTQAADSLKVSTLRLRLAAISQAHKTAGYRLETSAPEVRKVMSGIARTKGVAVSKKDAITDAILRDAVRAYATGSNLKAKRDRAILTVGFFAALRRSELAAINVEDVSFTDEGAIITLHRRKTDQEGQGTDIGLTIKPDTIICPVDALRSWIDAAAITEGALFRSISKSDRLLEPRLGDKDVDRIIKSATQSAGYNSDSFGGHSLRSGFITTCARKGVPERIIANQSGHKSINVLRGYVRKAGVFQENAAAMI